MVLQGHEATVCSVVADEHKIVSGAADKVSTRKKAFARKKRPLLNIL